MLEKNKKDVLTVYRQHHNKGLLPANLLDPTTANLRNESVARFLLNPKDEIRQILQSFAGVGHPIVEAQDIENIDADKFRPLQKYMKGQIEKPNVNTVALLAWLIDLDENVDKVPSPILPLSWWSRVWGVLAKYPIMVIMIIILCGVIVYTFVTRNRCMYWTGVEYKRVACEEGVKYTPRAVVIDKEKLTRFKRITQSDTLTYYSIGKAWYTKIDSFPEFYTASGMHPIDEKRKLKRVSKYIIDKYILRKNLHDSLEVD